MPRLRLPMLFASILGALTTVSEARKVARQYPSGRVRIVPSRGHASDLYYPYRSPAVRWIRRFVGTH